MNKSIRNMKTMLLLSTCYSSNIGGTGVITGSGTNLVAIEFLGNLDPKHHGNYASLTFATWMGFNVLPMLINVVIAWLYLQLVFLGLPNRYRFWKSRAERDVSNALFNDEIKTKITTMLKEKYHALGSMTVHEIGVTILFFIVVSSWVLHDPKIIPGWSSLFTKAQVSISSSSLLISVLFFIVPRNGEFYRACINRGRLRIHILENIVKSSNNYQYHLSIKICSFLQILQALNSSRFWNMILQSKSFHGELYFYWVSCKINFMFH